MASECTNGADLNVETFSSAVTLRLEVIRKLFHVLIMRHSLVDKLPNPQRHLLAILFLPRVILLLYGSLLLQMTVSTLSSTIRH